MSVSINNQRVFFKKAGITDLSVVVNNYKKGAMPVFIEPSDSIIIGSELPFNSKYFHFGVNNTANAIIKVELWGGSSWFDATDVIDFTEGFKKNGYVMWHTDKKQWSCTGDSKDIPEISTTRVFNFYWTKISFNIALDNTTSLKYIGHKFCNDDDLFSNYPDLNNAQFFKAYDSTLNKNDWVEQEIIASEYLITDLKNRMIIRSESQILDWQIFTNYTAHKSADIIFRGLGGSQIDEMERARKEYNEVKNLKFNNVDLNKSANLDCRERTVMQGTLSR